MDPQQQTVFLVLGVTAAVVVIVIVVAGLNAQAAQDEIKAAEREAVKTALLQNQERDNLSTTLRQIKSTKTPLMCMAVSPNGKTVAMVKCTTTSDKNQTFKYDLDTQTIRSESAFCLSGNNRDVIGKACVAGDKTQKWIANPGSTGTQIVYVADPRLAMEIKSNNQVDLDTRNAKRAEQGFML